MGVKTAVKAFIILIPLFSLSGCGDLMLFPSNGSYQIKATVNDYSLDDCSLIRAEDKIRPYFAVSVAKDPDLTALLVYLRNSQGAQIGKKVRYMIGAFSEADKSSDPAGGETADLVIRVSSFDKDLPYLPLPERLEPGSYTLVFETMGGNNILSRTETEIFYMGNIEFSLKDISAYLPGVSSSRLISPGAMIMLEAGLDYDSRLDPYVIWYNGKNIISEGRIKDGAGNILRKMPEQADFYSVRLEVLPFPLKPGLLGYSREITLTVSPKAFNTGFFFTDGPQFAAYRPLVQGTVFPEQAGLPAAAPARPELLRLYQFGGTMHDSFSATQAESDLTPVFDTPPKWVTVGQSFGLSTGPADSYFLPPFSFFRETPIRDIPEQGGGIFLLHVKPAEGVIFNAFFPFRASTSEGVTMEMTATENSVVLRLSTPYENDTKLYLYPAPSARRTYIPVWVEFFFRLNRLEARLTLGEPPLKQSVTGTLRLHYIVAGEGRIRLGGGTALSADQEIENSPTHENTNPGSMVFFRDEIFSEKAEKTESDTALPESPAETEKKIIPSVTVWNEFAVLYSRLPLLPEDNIITAKSEAPGSENTEEIPIAADQDKPDSEEESGR